MEITLHSRGPVCCRRPCPTVGRCFRVRPCLCPSSQTPTCCKQVLSVRAVPQMTASSDYPRRRSRKSLIPKTEGSSPRGFAPRPQVGISTQKKNQEEQKEDDAVIEQIGPYAKNVEASSISPISKIPVMLDDVEENDGEGIVSIRSDGNEEEEADIDEMMSRTEWSQDENSDIINSEKGATELITADTDGQMIPDAKKVKSSSISPTSKVPIILEEVKEKHLSTEHEEILSTISDANEEEADYDEIMSRTEWMSDENSDTMNSLEGAMELSTAETDGIVRAKISSKSVISGGLHNVETGETPATKETAGGVLSNKMTLEEKQLISSEEGRHITDTGDDLNFNVREGLDTEESLVDETEIDPQAQIEMLEKIAEENLSKGEKVFVFPNVVMGDKVVQVFLNRGISTLLNEPDIFIKGAFNEWKWKSFTEKLQKSNLHGDWWSCEIHVPKEAYMMDFVFFNGAQVYENNNYKDFHIAVESGMDAHAFEDFLIEEKRRELERLAQEQAERERQAEEQRRKEEEEAGRQADKAQATLEVEKRRQALQHVIKQAVTSVDNLWHIEPSTFKVADTVRLFYNRSSRPLVHAAEIWIHGGYNNWNDGPSIAEKLSCASRQDGDWWYADVVIPDRAFVLDWVFADGPPRNARVYDNNNSQDFHAIVPNYISEDFYWVEEEQRIFNKLQEERKVKEEAVRQKAVKTARMKAETKSRTMKNFLLSQKHIVYTEPLDVQAGKMATVFYNPSNTVLNGKPDIWFRCSFNRWTHHAGPLPAQKMVPAENGSHVKANVKVPFDAYMMDFVFSDNKEGDVAAYDNKNGMDYHIPVTGGVLKEPPMHIVHVAVEMAPIAKVGGLGDVVTSLSRAVQDLGHTVEIILPKYDCMNLSNVKDFQFNQSFAWGGTEIKVWFGKVEGLSVYFLEPQNGMFWAGCIYGGRNDAERFGFFCHAALEFLLQRGSHPDILHCHDWTSAPVAWLFKEHYRHYGLSDARVVFTIHNLEFGAHFIGKAMLHADKATTVSQTYSREVSGNPAIAPHLPKFHGIVNGIDPDIWDPYNDNFIPVPYTSENVVEGKKAAKEVLQQRLGLKRSDQPLVGIITRLTVQKGIHLIKHAISQTLQRNGQVVLLGSAPDPRIQNDFSNLANQLHSLHGDSVRLCLTYDEPLSHLIYAGADFILVPSIFEPCGLTQLIAMRYGSIPVVRRTGGLYDTVFDVDNDKERAQAQGLEPNGFSFDGADSAGVDYALNRALSAWYDGRDWFNSLCQRVMEQDWSWNRPALDYMELYYSARK